MSPLSKYKGNSYNTVNFTYRLYRITIFFRNATLNYTTAR